MTSSFFFTTGAPLLGATEMVKATLSGFTFGLPVSEVTSPFSFLFVLVIITFI